MKLELSLCALVFGVVLTPQSTLWPLHPTLDANVAVYLSDSILPNPCNDYVIRFHEDTLFRTPEVSLTFLPDPNSLIWKVPFEHGALGVIIGYHYDHFVALYRSDSIGVWKQSFCGEGVGGEDFLVTMPDLNFDGHPDLLIDGDNGGIYGNHFAICFLYDSVGSAFQRYPALDLENLTLDEYTRQIRSVHYGSKYGACIKQLYTWQQDSIVLLEEALYHADADSAYIAFKSRLEDGTIQYHKKRGLTEPLWHFFVDFALWEGF